MVHQESALNSLGDLQDCTWAYHERASHVEDHFLDKQGLLALNGKEVVETSSQARALRLVLDKKAEVTAIDARLLDLVRRNSPAMAARLRVVSTCCYSPGPLVVVAAGLDAALKQEIHKAFLTVHLDQFFVHRLHEGAIERFVSASNKQYHRVRRWYERSGRLLASVPVAKLQAEARIPASLS